MLTELQLFQAVLVTFCLGEQPVQVCRFGGAPFLLWRRGASVAWECLN